MTSIESGWRFGAYTVLLEIKDVSGHYRWMCRCDCGTIRFITAARLRRGESRSCIACVDRKKPKTHGHCKTSSSSITYKSWKSMKGRCCNPRNDDFHRYGAKGIKVCERWMDFQNFLADMGERPSPEMTIDRLDGSKGYEPGNCKWSTPREQSTNRRSTRFIEFHGERLSVAEWARRTGVSWTCINYRIKTGWPLELAIFKPSNRKAK